MRVEAVIAIQQLLALYGHVVDGEPERLGEVFAYDAVFDGRRSGRDVYRGLDAIRAFFEPRQPPHPPSHNTYNVFVYERDGAVRARSKWMAIDRGSGDVRSGDYDDRLVEGRDGWRIQERVATVRWWPGPTANPVDLPGPERADALERLDAIEAIKQLKALYFHLVDTKQWDRWRALFEDDAQLVGRFHPDGTSPDEFVATVRQRLGGDVISVHHGHTPIIELTGPCTARGIWRFFDWIQEPGAVPHRIGYGYYYERYRRSGDAWRIDSMRIVRLRVDNVHTDVAPIAPLPDLGALASQWP
jgi:3-phenylpropionate/cinnamic acid dioxygenase small subunit